MNSATLDRNFSPTRILLLIRNRILDDASGFLIAAGGVFALKLIILLIQFQANRGVANGNDSWTTIIALSGILVASRAFERMHDGRNGPEWVLLPASPLEKYGAAFLSYLLLYPLIAVVVATVISALLAGVGALMGAGGPAVWNPLRVIGIDEVGSYLTFTCVALAGSARFRKYALVKTAAISVGWAALLGILCLASILMFRWGSLSSLGGSRETMQSLFMGDVKMTVLKVVSTIMQAALFIAAVLYGYFRVCEKESLDEVQ